MNRVGFHWIGLHCNGLHCTGSHRIGLSWTGLHWFALVGFVLNLLVSDCSGLALIALDGNGLGVIRRVVVDWIALE